MPAATTAGIASGRLADDRSDMALAIDLLGSGAVLGEVLPASGRQEMLENLINDYMD